MATVERLFLPCPLLEGSLSEVLLYMKMAVVWQNANTLLIQRAQRVRLVSDNDQLKDRIGKTNREHTTRAQS